MCVGMHTHGVHEEMPARLVRASVYPRACMDACMHACTHTNSLVPSLPPFSLTNAKAPPPLPPPNQTNQTNQTALRPPARAGRLGATRGAATQGELRGRGRVPAGGAGQHQVVGHWRGVQGQSGVQTAWVLDGTGMRAAKDQCVSDTQCVRRSGGTRNIETDGLLIVQCTHQHA